MASGFTQRCGGFERSGIDSLQREMWAGFDSGLLRLSLDLDTLYQVPRTRCSSLANMPLPMIATPIVMIAVVEKFARQSYH
jgi:hypothetical protein